MFTTEDKKALERYFDVDENKKVAKFLIAKTISVDFSKRDPDKILWKVHDEKIGEFMAKQKEYDREGRGIPEKFPKNSLLDLKSEIVRRTLKKCNFCERKCGVNRVKGEKGFCNLTDKSYLSSEFLHHGEEPCLIPSHTLFFLGCNFYCIYCQNWSISRQKEIGSLVTGKDLARLAEYRRVHSNSRNINLVGGDPTPNLHTILEMLEHLKVNVPVVWNSNMYMSRETLGLLEGLVDVYLGDFKYGNNKCAKRLSKVPNYWNTITRNYLLARKHAEILIRHLVLPNHLECCTKPIMEWLGKNLGNSIKLNIMGQYRPEFEAFEHREISRRPSFEEMDLALKMARENGLGNFV